MPSQQSIAGRHHMGNLASDSPEIDLHSITLEIRQPHVAPVVTRSRRHVIATRTHRIGGAQDFQIRRPDTQAPAARIDRSSEKPDAKRRGPMRSLAALLKVHPDDLGDDLVRYWQTLLTNFA